MIPSAMGHEEKKVNMIRMEAEGILECEQRIQTPEIVFHITGL